MSQKRPRAQGGPPINQSTLRKASWKWLSVEQQNELDGLYERKSSAVLQLAEDASPDKYFDTKCKDLEWSCTTFRTELRLFKKLMQEEKITRNEYQKAIGDLEDTINDGEGELRVIKKQKKHLMEDIEEMAAPRAKLRQSWLNLLSEKVAIAGTAKKKTFNQSRFRENILDHYGAEKIENGVKSHYCVILGEWVMEKITKHGSRSRVKAAHIVPKVLGGSDLDKLFGVGETLLQDPRNGLPLFARLEEALDDGDICIVPDEVDGPYVKTLKMVIVNEKIRDQAFAGDGLTYNIRRFQELDGRVLSFLSAQEVAEAQATLPKKTRERLERTGRTPDVVAENRPAQRFLYFRTVTTYLGAKRKVADEPGLSSWVERYEKGGRTMWATPGKYIRESMLAELAIAAGDLFLPEAKQVLGLEKSEEESEKADTMEWETNKIAALGLKAKILQHEHGKQNSDSENDDSEDNDSENNDSENGDSENNNSEY